MCPKSGHGSSAGELPHAVATTAVAPRGEAAVCHATITSRPPHSVDSGMHTSGYVHAYSPRSCAVPTRATRCHASGVVSPCFEVNSSTLITRFRGCSVAAQVKAAWPTAHAIALTVRGLELRYVALADYRQ